MMGSRLNGRHIDRRQRASRHTARKAIRFLLTRPFGPQRDKRLAEDLAPVGELLAVGQLFGVPDLHRADSRGCACRVLLRTQVTFAPARANTIASDNCPTRNGFMRSFVLARNSSGTSEGSAKPDMKRIGRSGHLRRA